jgi:chromosome segregation ATPase
MPAPEATADPQRPDERRVLRAQVLALANAEEELRRELASVRSQLVQMARREATARSLLKEQQSLARGLQETARMEAAESTAHLKQSLEAERAAREKSESELTRATNALRELRGRPDAEMETLRALFADLMRGEAQGRQRLESLQQKLVDHERRARELQAQLDEEQRGRRNAEAQLASSTPLPVPAGAQALPAEAAAQLREQLREQQAQGAAQQQRADQLAAELAEERGRARAQGDRAEAELEWARDRARAATEGEQEAKDALFALRAELAQAKERLRDDDAGRQQATAQLVAQVAEARQRADDERARANAEIGRRVQAAEALREAANAAALQARNAAADLVDERAVASLLRDQVGRLELQRDAAKDSARDSALREQQVQSALAAAQARLSRVEPELEGLRERALAHDRTLAEAQGQASLAQKERDEAQRGTAGLQAALEAHRAASRARPKRFASWPPSAPGASRRCRPSCSLRAPPRSSLRRRARGSRRWRRGCALSWSTPRTRCASSRGTEGSPPPRPSAIASRQRCSSCAWPPSASGSAPRSKSPS